MSSLHAVDWVLLDHTAQNPVRVGDVVSVEAGGMPIYQVVGVGDGQIWIGDERRPSPRVMPLEAFRWRGGAR